MILRVPGGAIVLEQVLCWSTTKTGSYPISRGEAGSLLISMGTGLRWIVKPSDAAAVESALVLALGPVVDTVSARPERT